VRREPDLNDMLERQPLSQTDKRCLAALAGILVTVAVGYELTDGAALRAAEADKPPAEIILEMPELQPRLLEALQSLDHHYYRSDVPLDQELQTVLLDACEEHDVPYALALGLIEVESRFQPDADNGLCYGLCQLNKRWFPADLTPAENIQAGVEYLGRLLGRYEDTAAALTAFNAGHDTGSRTYADAVLAAAGRWEGQICAKTTQSAG